MTTLYSLRTDGDQYRITKFVDGEVESSYLSTQYECECPAGHRPSCRHRQMIPDMLARGICNTHWFWDFDLHRVVDFNGQLKSNIDALNELAAERVVPNVTATEIDERIAAMPGPDMAKIFEPLVDRIHELAAEHAVPPSESIVPAGPLTLTEAAGPPSEVTIAHSITLNDDATSEAVEINSHKRSSAPWRRL